MVLTTFEIKEKTYTELHRGPTEIHRDKKNPLAPLLKERGWGEVMKKETPYPDVSSL
jgi:hypothetical protein